VHSNGPFALDNGVFRPAGGEIPCRTSDRVTPVTEVADHVIGSRLFKPDVGNALYLQQREAGR